MNLNLLKSRNFSLLMLGKLVSLLGTNMQNFAFSMYVLQKTGSGTQFASILAIGMLPQLLLGPIGGVFADWFDKKKMLVILDFLSGLVIASIAWIYYINGGLEMIHIYVAVVSLSVISVLFTPAANAIIPVIVDKKELMDANSIKSLAQSIPTILGPMLAGATYGFGGLLPILIINSISFTLSAISETFIDIPKVVTGKVLSLEKFHTDLMEGFRYIKTNRKITKLTIVAFMTNFSLTPMFSVGLIYLSQVVLKISEFQLGLLSTIGATGMLVAPMLTGTIIKRFKIDEILSGVVILAGVMTGLISIVVSSFFLNLFSTNIVPYISMMVIIFIVVGLAVLANISLQTTFQREVPREMLGRVGSVLATISTASVPLGQIVIGRLFDTTIPIVTPIIVAVLLLTIGLFYKNPLGITLKPKKVVTVEDHK